LSLRFLSAFSRNFSASLPRKVGISLITIAMIVDSNLLIIRNYNLRSAMSITLIQINVYLLNPRNHQFPYESGEYNHQFRYVFGDFNIIVWTIIY
jgi:hypothetical protein